MSGDTCQRPEVKSVIGVNARAEVDQAGRHDPLVSVIVCAYNDPDSLRRALLSVLEQTYRNVQVVVSDDAGPVSVKSVCDELAPRFPAGSFRYFRQDRNLGVARNKIWAFAQSNARYCAFLEHDDEWIDSRFLQSAIDHMENDSSILVVAGNALVQSTSSSEETLQYRNTDKHVILRDDWRVFDGPDVSRALLKPLSIRGIVLGSRVASLAFSWSSIVFRADAVRELGELSAHVLLADDAAREFDVYANEESFMFLHRLLARGKCAMTGRAVSFRGRPTSAFSISPNHPGRMNANDVEVFNYLALADRIGGENSAVRKALRRRATSVGLAHVSPKGRDFLRSLDFGAPKEVQALFNHVTHKHIRRMRAAVLGSLRRFIRA